MSLNPVQNNLFTGGSNATTEHSSPIQEIFSPSVNNLYKAFKLRPLFGWVKNKIISLKRSDQDKVQLLFFQVIDPISQALSSVRNEGAPSISDENESKQENDPASSIRSEIAYEKTIRDIRDRITVKDTFEVLKRLQRNTHESEMKTSMRFLISLLDPTSAHFLMYEAARAGEKRILQYTVEEKWTDVRKKMGRSDNNLAGELFEIAIEFGNETIIDYLLGIKGDRLEGFFLESGIVYAAKNNQMKLAKKLLEYDKEKKTISPDTLEELYQTAKKSSNEEFLRYLQNTVFDRYYKHISFRFPPKRRGDVHGERLKDAAKDGHEHLVRYLVEQPKPENGRSGFSSRLYKNDIRLALSKASSEGHLNIAEYLLRTQGRRLSNISSDTLEELYQAAKKSSNEEFLRYLQSTVFERYYHGPFPFSWGKNGKRLKDAAIDGHEHLVRYLIEQPIPYLYKNDIGLATAKAISEGHLNIAEYLLRTQGRRLSNNSLHTIAKAIIRTNSALIAIYFIKYCRQPLENNYALQDSTFIRSNINYCLILDHLYAEGNLDAVKSVMENKLLQEDEELYQWFLFNFFVLACKQKNRPIIGYLIEESQKLPGIRNLFELYYVALVQQENETVSDLFKRISKTSFNSILMLLQYLTLRRKSPKEEARVLEGSSQILRGIYRNVHKAIGNRDHVVIRQILNREIFQEDRELYKYCLSSYLKSACENGHLSTLKYLTEDLPKENEAVLEMDFNLLDLLSIASDNHHQNIIDYLIEISDISIEHVHGFGGKQALLSHAKKYFLEGRKIDRDILTDIIVSAASEGDVKVLKDSLAQKMVKNDGPFFQGSIANAFVAASENGHLDIVQYLLGHELGKNIGAYYLTSAAEQALNNGQMDVYHYLIEKKGEIISSFQLARDYLGVDQIEVGIL